MSITSPIADPSGMGTSAGHRDDGRRLHPLAIRIMHWTNAVAMFIMIGSGWKIYNDEVLFGWLHFPEWMTIGGEAQGRCNGISSACGS